MSTNTPPELFMEHQNRPPPTPPSSSPRASFSSPPRRPVRSVSPRLKRNPTVTPRTFKRFFTPRSSLNQTMGSPPRHALTSLKESAANRVYRNQKRRPLQKEIVSISGKENTAADLGFTDIPEGRKRRSVCSPETTPERLSPQKRLKSPSSLHASEEHGLQYCSTSEEETESSAASIKPPPKPLAKSITRGMIGRMLRRELDMPIDGIRRAMHDYCGDFQNQTTAFCTRPEDCHLFNDQACDLNHDLPFSVASCNTNSLIAVGYEGGAVRLIESNKKEKPPFHEAYLTFQPHLNAILDLAFSSDDLLLATASGDQTSQVIDMPTQRAIATLSGHAASVKHVRFQPGSSNSVLATSSRDGSVQIWDLRCKGSNLPVGVLQQSLDPTETQRVSTIGKTSKMSWARSIGIVENAHMGRRIAHSSRAEKSGPAIDTDYKTDVVSSRGDISITGLSFLSPSLPHLLLTGSARHASVKLWDVRNIQNHRGRGQPIPLSTTRQPQSHDRHREYGLTSMLISPDGARLYTLCRDHTVYAYSTSHLILGSAPELDLWGGVPRQRSRNSPETSGLGPLYGFRHPGLHVTTFYVKMAIRPAKDNRTETLAVGSSDHCSVLFPTDERYMQGHGSRASSSNLEAPLPSTPSLPPGSGRISVDDSIPIYRNGSALVRGHDKEVTGVSWTSRGDLVTISDDFKARIWREDAARARDLRLVGEASGDRWGHGWAECQPGWDGSG